MKKNNSSVWHILSDSVKMLLRNDPLRMGGATAFFTMFALPPILIILTFMLGFFSDKRYVAALFKDKIANVVDVSSANEITRILHGIQQVPVNTVSTIGGILFLLFISTTLFNIIKNSVNQIWEIKADKETGISYSLGLRLRSLAVILIAGILFGAGIILESGQAVLGEKSGELFPGFEMTVNILLNHFSSFVIVTIWFAILFRYLPDGKSTVRNLIAGSAVASFLFNIGKLLFRHLLTSSNVNSIYGASGSLILLLLFVFYASLILYFGAAVIKSLSDNTNNKIVLLSHGRKDKSFRRN